MSLDGRGLRYFWKINLAVLAAAAVNTSVLAGALIVGDSVRGSLRNMTLDRLGDIDLALVAERFFPADLADRLAAAEGFGVHYTGAAPAILLPGSAVRPATGARASGVNVHGVDARFTALFDGASDLASETSPAGSSLAGVELGRGDGQMFPSAVINESLQRQLGAEVGDAILLSFRTRDDIPDDTLLGNKENVETFGTLRATVVQVIADAGIGRFSLSPHQAFPSNVFIALGELQEALDQEGRANAVFVSGDGGEPMPAGAEVSVYEQPARQHLRRVLRLADLGLELDPYPGGLLVESAEYVLRPVTVEAIEAVALDMGATVMRVTSYLATSLTHGERLLPYSTVAAIGGAGATGAAAERDALLLTSGEPAPIPQGNEILLNAWAAADLGAAAGDIVRMEYYVVGPYEKLDVEASDFVVSGVVAMSGLGADRQLTPAYPGIENTENIADWDPPFPVDLGLVRPEDEAYWDEYAATPKAFVSEELATELWSTRYGSVTSMRLQQATPNGLEPAFSEALLRRLNLPQFGMRFLEVKAEGLDAAAGATDFSGLFIGFSFFLIASAAMLVGLLFSLGVEARAGEIGLLLSVGFTVRRVRLRMLYEGGALAALGAFLGLAAGVGYAALMMLGLRTLWLPAVGTPMLRLHVVPTSLIIGWLISVLVVLLSIWWTVRRLGRASATSLLRGSSLRATAASSRRRGVRRATAWLATGFAIVMLAYAIITRTTMDPMVFGTIGFPLLVGGLAAFAEWCSSSRGHLDTPGTGALIGMAARNSAWSPGRSILSVALVAFASFVIVTVAANHRDPTRETRSMTSGTGGLALYATSDIPMHEDLSSPEARFDLGFSDSDEAVLAGARILALRALPGDDASCLNLYRPQKPRLLGASTGLVARGGFSFATALPPDESGAAPGGYDPSNLWTLLYQDFGTDVVPVIGDANSVQWILHMGLGDDLIVQDELGAPLRLRIVGTFAESIFRSELLMSEANLLAHFPSQSGYSTFLVAIDGPDGRPHTGAEADFNADTAADTADDDRIDAAAEALERALGPYGFDAERTDRKLAAFLVVQNTYLSTFQLLGGLGLLLGTVGLAVVMVRNVIERRAELATLRAFGYRRSTISRMVLAESTFLLVVGTIIGSGSALIAVAPRFVAGGLQLPWGSLALILLAVLAVGTSSSIAAVSGALRIPLLPVLKGDR